MTSRLVDGPRGRRFLYELLARAEQRENGEYNENSLVSAMWDLSIRLTRDDGSHAVATFEWTGEEAGASKRKGNTGRLIGRIRKKWMARSRGPWHRSGSFRFGLKPGWAAHAPAAGYTSGQSFNPVPHWKEGVPPVRDLVTSAKVAVLIREASKRLGEEKISMSDLVQALAESVISARYWQEPDMIDIILSDPVVADALRDSEEMFELLGLDFEMLVGGGVELAATWLIDETDSQCVVKPSEQVLDAWLKSTVARTESATRERPDDPTANWSGHWWSTPPRGLLVSNGETVDGDPAAFSCTEDGPISTRAEIRELTVPEKRVLVIENAEDWAELSKRFPLDITAEVRHDWFRVTGLDVTWIIPNWRDVAREWDGVKLSVRGYLTSATRAIDVGDNASMIAGWGPGETFWLNGEGIFVGESEIWEQSNVGDLLWERVSDRHGENLEDDETALSGNEGPEDQLFN